MNFEQLQQEWQSVKSEPKSHDELRRMMYSPSVYTMKRITQPEKIQLIAKVAMILAMIFLFDLFGSWSTGISAGWGIYVFLNEYLGLAYLRMLPQTGSINEALAQALARLQRVSLVSRLANGAVWLTLVIVLGMTVQLGSFNTLWWALILLPVLVVADWWNGRNWSARIRETEELLSIYYEDPDPAVEL